jgi:protein phosphatase
MLISTTVCHPGLARDQNEDSCYSNTQDQLWLVADGVGGNRGGEVASQLAVQTIERRYRQGLSLQEAVMAAHQAIRDTAEKQNELAGMASTIVAVCFNDDEYELAWLGDSRVYLIDEHRIEQLSSDHNVANALFQNGDIKQDELFDHPGQHELTQALGQCSLQAVPLETGRLQVGQCLLLCTDGLSGVLAEREIWESVRRLFSGRQSLDGVADDLLQRVLSKGAPDNVGFTLIQQVGAVQSDSVSNASLSERHAETDSAHIAGKRKTLNLMPVTWMILLLVVLVMCLIIIFG